MIYKIAKSPQKNVSDSRAPTLSLLCQSRQPPLLFSALSLCPEFAMQLTTILIAAFAFLANAECHHPHYYNYTQQNKAAQAVGSGTNGNTGSGNGYGSNSGTTATGTGIGAGTGTGTGTNGNVLNSGTGITGNNASNVASPGSQSSGSTGTYGNDASNVASQGSQSSGLNTGTNSNVFLKAAFSGSQSSGSGSIDSGSTNSGSPSTSSGNSAGGSTASFTQYGPCHRTSVACGWYSSSGYNAAISQAVYGGGPGSGASRECGVCWRLTPNAPDANEIVVKVNDLCPDDGNPLCAQPAGESLPFFFIIIRTGPEFFQEM